MVHKFSQWATTNLLTCVLPQHCGKVAPTLSPLRLFFLLCGKLWKDDCFRLVSSKEYYYLFKAYLTPLQCTMQHCVKIALSFSILYLILLSIIVYYQNPPELTHTTTIILLWISVNKWIELDWKKLCWNWEASKNALPTTSPHPSFLLTLTTA